MKSNLLARKKDAGKKELYWILCLIYLLDTGRFHIVNTVSGDDYKLLMKIKVMPEAVIEKLECVKAVMLLSWSAFSSKEQ